MFQLQSNEQYVLVIVLIWVLGTVVPMLIFAARSKRVTRNKQEKDRE